MKLHLPHLLHAALMTCMACAPSLYAASYTAEGVDVSGFECNYGTNYEYHATFADTTDRFYDGGKGRDWSTFSSAAYNIYVDNKQNLNVFGELASDITVGSGYLNFDKLDDDSGHCWAYTSSNAIQYWQSYYGVFANKVGETTNPTPVHGYTYGKEHIDTLGGTQSLKLNMLFYENWLGSYGGTTSTAFSWYLGGGQSTNDNLVTGAAGGYFKQYFTDPNATCNVTSVWNGAYTLTADEFANSIKTHFGYEQAADGTYELTNKGQILYLELIKTGASHAITCYGFETNDSGQITSLYVVNSDDADMRLVKLYGKLTDRGYELFTDQLCTVTYNDWRVTGWSSINTPEVLKDMLAEYESGNLTWMGNLDAWTNTAAVAADVNELPTNETGWMAYAGTNTEHAGYYNTYYTAGRGVEFNDEADSGTVNVAEDIDVASMTVNNDTLAYSFDGGDSLKTITATGDFIKKGTGAVEFNNVKLIAQAVDLESDATFDQLQLTGNLKANGNTVAIKGDSTFANVDTDLGENGTGTSSLVITGGTTEVTANQWVQLKSLEMSDAARLYVSDGSLGVAGDISTTSTATGTLADGVNAGIHTKYCIKVGGSVNLAGDMTAENAYIRIGEDATIGGTLKSGGDVTVGGDLTLEKGGYVGGVLSATTATLKGDTSAHNIAGGTAVVVQGGTTSTREVAWTYLQSLEISETARYSSSASIEVYGDISTASTAVGTLPTDTEAGLEATYCIKVGGDVTLAGSMKSGAYVDITGGADIMGNLTSTGEKADEHYISIGRDLKLGGNLSSVQQVTIGGSASIGGITTISQGGLTVTDALTLKDNSSVNGRVAAGSLTLAVGKTLTTKGDLEVAGVLSSDTAGTQVSISAAGDVLLGGDVRDVKLEARNIYMSPMGGTATLTNAQLTVAADGLLTLENVVVDSSSLLSGGVGATLNVTDVTFLLGTGNTLLTQTSLARTAQVMTLTNPGPHVELSCSALEGLTITGTGITFDLSGLSDADKLLLDSAGSVSLTFTDGVDFSAVDSITLTMDGEQYAQAIKEAGSTSTFTFSQQQPPSGGGDALAIPEPTTATLSLLALAALAARRRRK